MGKLSFKNVLLLWLLPFIIFGYFSVASPYPYYSMWDSSHIYTLDALIAGSGQLPDHFFHPNMIPLVLEKYIILPIGILTGFLSTSSLSDLAKAPNPYLPFAETAEYLLAFGYMYMLVFLGFMYMAFFRLFSPQLAWNHGLTRKILIAALTGLSLIWIYIPVMAIWIRYETVGLALWSISFYSTIRASEGSNKWQWIALAGFFSGAAVLSKIQLAAGVAILPFLYVYLLKEKPLVPGPLGRLTCIMLVGGAFVFLSIVHYKAYYAFTNNDLPCVAFSTVIKSMSWRPLAPIGMGLLTFITSVAIIHTQRWPLAAGLLARIAVFAAAFVSILLFSLTLGSTWGDSAGSLYWTYIFSFGLGQHAFGEATGYFKPIDWSYHFPVIKAFSAAIFILALSYITSNNRISRLKFISANLLLLITVVMIVILTRHSLFKDGMMYMVWVTVAAIIAWHLMFKLHKSRHLVWVGCIMSLVWTGWQVAEISQFHQDKHSGGFNYNYIVNKWKNYSYNCRGTAYRKLIKRSYPKKESWESAFHWTLDIPGTKLLLAQVFQNRHIKLTDTALAFEKCRLRSGKPERISNLSQEITGALLVPVNEKRIVLHPRADYLLYIITTNRPSLLKGKQPRKTKLSFSVEKGEEAYSVYKVNLEKTVLEVEESQPIIAIVDNR